MYRPPRTRSTADVVPGFWNGSAAPRPFSQFATGREEEAVGDLDAQRHRSPEDQLNREEFHGEEAYTGAMDQGYFTDLLVNGVQQPQEPLSSSEPPIHLARSTTKSSQGRSKNFREERRR